MRIDIAENNLYGLYKKRKKLRRYEKVQTKSFRIYAIKVAFTTQKLCVGKTHFAGFLADVFQSLSQRKALGIEIFTCRGEAEWAVFTAEQRNANVLYQRTNLLGNSGLGNETFGSSFCEAMATNYCLEILDATKHAMTSLFHLKFLYSLK